LQQHQQQPQKKATEAQPKAPSTPDNNMEQKMPTSNVTVKKESSRIGSGTVRKRENKKRERESGANVQCKYVIGQN